MNKILRESKDYLLLDFNNVKSNQEDDDEKLSTVTHRRHHKKLSQKEKALMSHMESLDFSEIDNMLLRQFNSKQKRWAKILKTFGKWVICSLIGIFVGLAVYILKKCVDLLQDLKFESVEKYTDKSIAISFFIYLSFNLGYALISSVFVILFGPMCSSSGLPEVKGYLNGIRIQKAFNLKTVIGKIASLIFSFSSGLVLGPEGPMFHIGSGIGSSISQFKSKTLNIHLKQFWRFQNDTEKRDFISCGAAAGIAAAFGAPIGGVLFALEEGSSFWSRQLTWRTFFSCLVATLIANFFLQDFAVAMHDYGVLAFGVSKTYLYTYSELIPFCLIGIIGGLIGALFVHLNIRINYLRKKYLGANKIKRLAEVAIIVIITSVICFFPPLIVDCKAISAIPTVPPDVCDVAQNEEPVSFFCGEMFYNPLASLTFTTQEGALKLLYSRTNGIFSPAILLCFAIFYFGLAVITSGLYMASGIFIPMMVIGAAWGRLIGILLSSWFTPVDQSIYALVGSAAMMAGSLRMTISLVVIIVELTEGTQYLLPVILVVMLAKWTGDAFNESVYEHLIELKYIPFLPSQSPLHTRQKTVADVMAKEVKTVPEIVSVRTVVELLTNTTHNGFPVVMIPQLHDENNSNNNSKNNSIANNLNHLNVSASLSETVDYYNANNNNNNNGSINNDDEFGSGSFSNFSIQDDYQNNMEGAGDINLRVNRKRFTKEIDLFSKHQKEGRTLCGLILRSQLSILLMKKIFILPDQLSSLDFLSNQNTNFPIDHQTFSQDLASKIPSIEAITKTLTQQDFEKLIDLRPYMNFAVVSIKNYSSMTEAYRLFRLAGLRHLVVVNVFNQIVGMLTRKDLL
eukprot:gene2121-2612_t